MPVSNWELSKTLSFTTIFQRPSTSSASSESRKYSKRTRQYSSVNGVSGNPIPRVPESGVEESNDRVLQDKLSFREAWRKPSCRSALPHLQERRHQRGRYPEKLFRRFVHVCRRPGSRVLHQSDRSQRHDSQSRPGQGAILTPDPLARPARPTHRLPADRLHQAPGVEN